MSTGLTLIDKIPETIEDSYMRIFVVALASGDPTALSTSGKSIGGPSWLRLPVGGDDIRGDLMLDIPPTILTITISEKTLLLEFGILGHVSDFQYPSLDLIEKAALIVRNRKQFRGQGWNWITQLDQNAESTTLYPPMERFYIESLGCALYMGTE